MLLSRYHVHINPNLLLFWESHFLDNANNSNVLTNYLALDQILEFVDFKNINYYLIR